MVEEVQCPEYYDLVAWLVHRRPLGWGLERVKRVLHALEDPQDRMPTVHVAGTNGKGSCCAKVSAVLCETVPGRVGLTMSPHVITARERILVQNEMISRADFVHAVRAVLEAALELNEAQNLSFFEIITMAAFYYFYYGPKGESCSLCAYSLRVYIFCLCVDN